MPGRPLWVFAAAAGAVLALGAAAYAARAWIERARVAGSGPPGADRIAPVTSEPRPPRRRRTAETDRASDDCGARSAARRRTVRQDERGNGPADQRGAGSSCAPRARMSRAGTSRARWRPSRSTSTGSGTGGLVEEREALRVKSLAGLGRHEEAQRAAAAFHARFPHSVFLSTFERMKETDR